MNKLSKSSTARAPILFAMKARLAAAVLLAVLLVPRASATSNFIYVANTGENTVSKIDITLNQEVARYATWFGTTPFGPAPSRIARDSNDNAYVLDRFFANHLPVLLKIAPSGGTNTSSGSGLGAVLTMTDSSNLGHIDPSEITDNRILWASEIGTPGSDENKLGRALCVDTKGFLWVGIHLTHKYYQVNANTGSMTGVSVDTTASHQPYGCQVDMNGKLWSVNGGTTLAEIDTLTGTLVTTTPLNHSTYGYNYSLSLYNDCTSTPAKVTVYLSNSMAKTYIAYDPQANSFSNPAAVQVSSISVGVDSKGNIVSGAANGTGQVIKHSPSGALIWNQPGTGHAIPDLHGIIIDDNDDVWAVDRSNDQVIKYGGANGAYIATVKVGVQPYTYGNPPPPTCNGTPTPTPTPTPSPTPTPCAQVTGEARCLPNGGYGYTFNVTNNSGSAMSQILLTPAQGSTFTLNPQLTNLSPPLQNGQSTTVTTNIGNGKPGDKVCFFVSLMSDKDPCCTVQVCPTLPRCADTYPAATPRRPPPPVKRRR